MHTLSWFQSNTCSIFANNTNCTHFILWKMMKIYFFLKQKIKNIFFLEFVNRQNRKLKNETRYKYSDTSSAVHCTLYKLHVIHLCILYTILFCFCLRCCCCYNYCFGIIVITVQFFIGNAEPQQVIRWANLNERKRRNIPCVCTSNANDTLNIYHSNKNIRKH